jgi:SAM-dependent methyltransferase
LPGADPAILASWRAGEISIEIALVRLLLALPDAEALRRDLAASGAVPLVARLDENRAGIDRIVGMIREEASAGTAGDAIARWRALFDRAARASPEASVAFYSLGSATILAAATAEIVALLRRLGVLGGSRRALEIGCGIGRVALALAPELGEIVGIDIAPAMIEEARRRAAGIANAHFLETEGRDLRRFADASFGLVLAVDALPYVFDAGEPLVETHFREAARVLEPGGDFVVLNLSYRGDPERDRGDAERLAAGAGLEVLRKGTRDLILWDELTFHLRKQ